MHNYNDITITNTYEHLSLEHYEHIIREVTKHNAFHNSKKRNTGRTALIRSLAFTVGTSVSNMYSVIKDASILIHNYDFTLRCLSHLFSNLSHLTTAQHSPDIAILNVSPASRRNAHLCTSAALSCM